MILSKQVIELPDDLKIVFRTSKQSNGSVFRNFGNSLFWMKEVWNEM